MSLILQSQRDPRWANKPLGTSHVTIGQGGCTITAIAMKFGVIPDFLNDRLNTVNGFAPSNPNNPFEPECNLVIWKKLEEALPGITFNFRYYTYTDAVNEEIKKNLPCVVEVDASPIGGTRHWVLYIGNHMLYDPWDGKEKPTSSYIALGAAILGGEYKQPVSAPIPVIPVPDVVTVDDFDEYKMLQERFYKLKASYDNLEQQVGELNKTASSIQPVDETMRKELDTYHDMKLLGYTNTNDINKALKAKDDLNITLQTEISKVRQRNSELASLVQKIEEEDHTTAELGQGFIEENQELKNTLLQVGKAAGIDKVTTGNLVTSVFGLKDLADRFLKRIEEEQKKREEARALENPPRTKVASPTIDWLLNVLQLIPTGEGVK